MTESPLTTDVRISDESIKLGQFLKLADLVDSGAAKPLLAAGMVRVNDVVETRRGRQLVAGDVVAVAHRSVRVIVRQLEDPNPPSRLSAGHDSVESAHLQAEQGRVSSQTSRHDVRLACRRADSTTFSLQTCRLEPFSLQMSRSRFS